MALTRILQEDEPEDSDLTPLSDEEVVVAPVKRKRDVSYLQPMIFTH